jgi:PEP-CTERM motif
MKKFLVNLLGLFVLSTQYSYATIYDNLDYTTDTATQLDWLDLSFTTKKTYFQVETMVEDSNGVFKEWRIATGKEVDTFVLNYTNSSGLSSSNPDLYSSLITMLDSTYNKNLNEYGSFGMINVNDSKVPGYAIVKSLQRYLDTNDNQYKPSYGVSTQKIDNSTSSTTVGAFLVRASSFVEPSAVTSVPEPETYAMFLAGLGLLGFTARRRNK